MSMITLHMDVDQADACLRALRQHQRATCSTEACLVKTVADVLEPVLLSLGRQAEPIPDSAGDEYNARPQKQAGRIGSN